MNDFTQTKGRTVIAPPQTLVGQDAASVASAREEVPLALFHAAAERVPAYKDFLQKNGIEHSRIRTSSDFHSVPPVSKKNYLTQYPLEALCWDGTLTGKSLTYTATSGSTGAPFYFPRNASLDHRSSLMHELYLLSVSRGRVPSTLVIVSFGMGVWIGGVITYQAFRQLGERGYPVSVITPGTNKKEILEALHRIAPKYEQVIICGYPPFIKDVLEEAREHGFDAAKRPIKILFAAEGFSETFRDHAAKTAGCGDPVFGTANIYGSADLGTMAMETPLSIALRRRAVVHPGLYAALFSQTTKLPTFAQFHSSVAHFEEQEGEILVTGDSALPLLRYAIGDRGGVREYDDVMSAAQAVSPAFAAEMRGIAASNPPLPFVFIYERADFSVKLYGAIIYAEHVRAALQIPALDDVITGKYSMAVKRDEREDEFLQIDIELKHGMAASDAISAAVRDAVVTTLKKMNAEYHYLSDNLGARVVPRIVLWPYEHPDRFRPGAKQQWIKKP